MVYGSVLEYLADLKKQTVSFKGLQNSTSDLKHFSSDEAFFPSWPFRLYFNLCDEVPGTYANLDDGFFDSFPLNGFSGYPCFSKDSVITQKSRELLLLSLTSANYSGWNKDFLLQDRVKSQGT